MGQANDSRTKSYANLLHFTPPLALRRRLLLTALERRLHGWCVVRAPLRTRSARGVTTLFLISMADDDDWDTDPTFENNMTEAERRRAGERAMWKAPPRGSGQLAPQHAGASGSRSARAAEPDLAPDQARACLACSRWPTMWAVLSTQAASSN